MHDVAVIGAGLFGSIAARALSRAGKSVVVIDDARPDRGSAPAGCVIRPEWISSMKGKPFEEGLRLLDELYGVEQLSFELWPLRKEVKCFRVEPTNIWIPVEASGKPLRIEDKVLSITPQEDHVDMVLEEGRYISFRKVILACGIWAHELFEGVEVSGRYGWSWRGAPVEKPTIRPWAPYRQVVSFNMDDGRSWRGDGQALIEKSATKPKQDASFDRCFPEANGWLRVPEAFDGGTRGARPYVKDLGGKPCFYERRGNVWCVTGGGKNGTIAASWCAQRLVEEIC